MVSRLVFTSARVTIIAQMVEQILVDGDRPEVIFLLATMASVMVLVRDRARDLRSKSIVKGPALLTCREAAQELRLNEETVRVLIRRQELPAVKLGRALRVPRDAIERIRRDRRTE